MSPVPTPEGPVPCGPSARGLLVWALPRIPQAPAPLASGLTKNSILWNHFFQ